MNENYGILDRSIYILGIFLRNFFTKNIHILWKIQFDIVMHCKKRAENEKAISHRSRIIAFFFSTKPHWNVWVNLVHTYYLMVRRVNETRVLGICSIMKNWVEGKLNKVFLYFFCHLLNLSSTHFSCTQDFGLQVVR